MRELYTVGSIGCGTILPMESSPRSVTWEAPEHHHVEKGNDWFFALAIIIVALVIVAILLSDTLSALLIGLLVYGTS